MATLNEKMAESLAVLKAYQDTHGDNLVVHGTDTLGYEHTKRLVDSGYLIKVINGWYIPSFPGSEGDSTVWYVSYWHFISSYLDDRFGDEWCLSPELTLYFRSGSGTVPSQLVIRSETASNNLTKLPFGCSLLDLKASIPSKIERDERYGVHLYPLAEALLVAPPGYYSRHPLEARTCLSMIRDSSSVLQVALEGGYSRRAGRVSGALRSMGRNDIADEITSTMKRAGYDVREENPFEDTVVMERPVTSPYTSRIRLMWESMRSVVLKCAKAALRKELTSEKVLSMMDANYVRDSYNSLSIEGYRVTEGLIERVRSGLWRPDEDAEGLKRKGALAARGYYQAYMELRSDVESFFLGREPSRIYSLGYRKWHYQLFEPCARAGILKASDLAGYRNHQVYIRNSMHVPLAPDSILDAMETLDALMKGESEAIVRAVLGHFFFVYIHPYMDGNGRTARFVMNSQLVTSGYKWAIVPVERRTEYMKSLEKASVYGDIGDFSQFIVNLLSEDG